MTGEEYELFVKSLLELELNKSSKEHVIIEHQKKLKASDGTIYNIDLFFKIRSSGFEYWNIVECKYWNQFVGRDIINTILHKAGELGVHKSIVVSKKGFQKGAIELASKYRVALIKIGDDKSLTYYHHADGNLNGYLNFLSIESDHKVTDRDTLLGVAFPTIDIYDFIAERCGKEVSSFLKAGNVDNYLDAPDKELPPIIKAQLKKITPELLNEYQFIETGGLPLKLMNEPEIRMINMAAFLLKIAQ